MAQRKAKKAKGKAKGRARGRSARKVAAKGGAQSALARRIARLEAENQRLRGELAATRERREEGAVPAFNLTADEIETESTAADEGLER